MSTLQIIKEDYDKEMALELEKNKQNQKIVIKMQPARRTTLINRQNACNKTLESELALQQKMVKIKNLLVELNQGVSSEADTEAFEGKNEILQRMA